jgi:hypothetical protein
MRSIACVIVSLVAGLSLFGGVASAQTVEELKKQLAARMPRLPALLLPRLHGRLTP